MASSHWTWADTNSFAAGAASIKRVPGLSGVVAGSGDAHGLLTTPAFFAIWQYFEALVPSIRLNARFRHGPERKPTTSAITSIGSLEARSSRLAA